MSNPFATVFQETDKRLSVTEQDIEALARYVRSRDGDASPDEKHREFFVRMSEWLLSLTNKGDK